MNFFPVLKREKIEDFYVSLEHFMEYVYQSIVELRKLVNAYCDNDTVDMKKHGELIVNYEREADDKRRTIERSLYEGVIIPFGRQDKYELLEAIDDVVDKAEIFYRLAILSRPPILKILIKDIKGLALEVESTVQKLKNAVFSLNKDLKYAVQVAGTVKVDREKVRTLQLSVLEKLIKKRQGDPLDIIFLKDLLLILSKVADKAHTAADRVIALAVKYIS